MAKVKPTFAKRQAPFALTIYLFCEGGTEERYLDDFVKAYPLAKVVHIARDADPASLIRKARNWAYANRMLLSDSRVSVWVVFDDDGRISEIKRAAEEYAQMPKKYLKSSFTPEIHIAYMKPCFEVWGVLNVKDGLSHGRKGLPQTQSAMQSYLHEIMPRYHHEKSPYLDLSMMTELDQAIRRGEDWERPYGPFPKNISSSLQAGVYALCRRIREIGCRG